MNEWVSELVNIKNGRNYLVVDLVGDKVDISMSSIPLIFSIFSLVDDSNIAVFCWLIKDFGVSKPGDIWAKSTEWLTKGNTCIIHSLVT